MPELKVMLITGFAAVAVEAENAFASRTKVLSKPFHLRKLIGEVEKLLAALDATAYAEPSKPTFVRPMCDLERQPYRLVSLSH